jgi:hypothetical protein
MTAAAAAAAAADTSLAELNGSLLREEEGLVAGRGLVTGYTCEALLLLLWQLPGDPIALL